MWLKWFPWRYIVRHAAQAHGFIDPITILSRVRRFAQPSEVSEPIELLRAGVVFHARGLINTATIQHNLDWIWPYWVQRQFDPLDISFIPRSFSLTHVNLSHRNWTAIGLPDCRALPLIDPRGLITPFFNGWSLDAWIISEDGSSLIPSQLLKADQHLIMNDHSLAVVTEFSSDSIYLKSEAETIMEEKGQPVCRIIYSANSRLAGWLAIALRPYNPEGISFIHDLILSHDRRNWIINGKKCLCFEKEVERHLTSNYRSGDIFSQLPNGQEKMKNECEVGLITAAALYSLPAGQSQDFRIKIYLSEDEQSAPLFPHDLLPQSWSESLRGLCSLSLPQQPHFQYLFEAALRTLILHSPGEVYPGPYTYKRFWFRDAAFILQAMICLGMSSRVLRAIHRFLFRQSNSGYFHSQEGEWDSNGEALWIMNKYCELKGVVPPLPWKDSIIRGALWIKKKRMPDTLRSFQAGLLPAGFSAEHLGPNDFYYWDDFWSIAGLFSAAAMLASLGDEKKARLFSQEAEQFMASIERSIQRSKDRRKYDGIPAAPYRRMDAGAIGSIVVSYPLRLWASNDSRVMNTVEYLMKNCFVHGAFFQSMIHSGINAYLTLHLAQVLLRSGDLRFYDLLNTIANLASPTGQWPEAIHPRTKGGCMGDGQHVWAAAEWVMMMRHLFLREEGNRLILASGIVKEWLEDDRVLSFGPTLTPYGSIVVTISPGPEIITVSWEASWRGRAPILEIRLPGFPGRVIDQPEPSYVQMPRSDQNQGGKWA